MDGSCEMCLAQLKISASQSEGFPARTVPAVFSFIVLLSPKTPGHYLQENPNNHLAPLTMTSPER